MIGRRLALAAVALAAAGTAYGLYRLGARYRPEDPAAGLGEVVDTLRSRMRERERDLQDALGAEARDNGPRAEAGPTAGAAASPSLASAPLTAAQARELLTDPAGPRPGPDPGAGI